MKYTDFINRFILSSSYFPIKGNIITGTNGLYGERETSYRVLSHWGVLLKDARLNNDIIINFISLFLDEFMMHDIEQGPFKARYSTEKDTSNGLIGTAWNVEGMVSVIELCRVYGLTDYRDIEKILLTIIRKLYEHYPYSKRDCNWPHIVEPNGKILGLDRTFNHQLWFAASKYKAAKLLGDQSLSLDVLHFISNLKKNIKLNHVGAIYHTLGTYPHYHKTFIKRIMYSSYRRDMVKKEYGYHAFNLLGFVRMLDDGISQVYDRIENYLEVSRTKEFKVNQNNNKYGSSYNPVGLEMAAAISKVRHDDAEILYWLNYHFDNFFDSKSFSFINSDDIPTLNSRLYEMTYIDSRTKEKLRYDNVSNVWYFES